MMRNRDQVMLHVLFGMQCIILMHYIEEPFGQFVMLMGSIASAAYVIVHLFVEDDS